MGPIVSHQIKMDKKEGLENEGQAPKKKGLTFVMTIVFIIAEIAGAGMMSLPRAFANSGWIGVAILIYQGINAGVTGMLLGKCWMILEERWPMYRAHVGNPYPLIGERAVGRWIRIPVSFCTCFFLLGTCVVYMLLVSKFLQQIFEATKISFCVWVLVLSLVLLPISYLRAPHNFWFIAVFALVTTLIAYVIGIYVSIQDYTDIVYQPSPTGPIQFDNFFLALGTYSFAFGGAAAFPSFQNDMKERHRFPAAALCAFTILMALYVTIGLVGFIVYGDSVAENVLQSISGGTLRTVAQVSLIVHLFLAFQITINSPCQEIEGYLGVPKRFTYKRIAVRTTIVAVLLFFGETVPEFGKIMNLVGALTGTITVFIFPPIFYYFLCKDSNKKLSIGVKLYLLQILVIGAINGAIGTYVAIKSIVGRDSFAMPCYVAYFLSQ